VVCATAARRSRAGTLSPVLSGWSCPPRYLTFFSFFSASVNQRDVTTLVSVREADAVLTEHVALAEERVLVAGEGEEV